MTRFTPYPDWNAPGYHTLVGREVQRVVLAEVPFDTFIEFQGHHSASNYLCKVVEMERERMVKVWFNRSAQCVIGPIRNIVAVTMEDIHQKSGEEGVMEIGKMYVMPYFIHSREGGKLNTNVDYSQIRTEPYRRILLNTPEMGR